MPEVLMNIYRRRRKRIREQKILCHVDLGRAGLEIGPSHLPIVAKKNGFKVKVLDHTTADELRLKYRADGVNLDAIEEVDFVWSGQPFRELVGSERFAWIIASHVIEHTPDLIGFINDCDAIMEEDGVLSLAVPDRRYCFDHFREDSSLGKVIDAHEAGQKVHSAGSVADYFLHVTTKAGRLAWNWWYPGRYRLIHTAEQARAAMRLAREGQYVDVHAWCFTPAGFRLLIEDLHRLGYIKLREMAFFGAAGHEFYVTLGRRGNGPPVARERLLARKARER